MENTFGTGRIIRENEPSSGQRTIMRIGSAGEKLVSYACVITETYRHFGRLGLGAVFGSKKLKAVVVSGKRSLPTLDKKEYRTVYDEIFKAAVSSPVMKKYHDLGTPENVKPLNLFGGLPTRNLRTGHFEGADKISGESFAEKYLGRRLACSHCPVGCIHIAALREPHPHELYFYKTTMISYDYELIFALGSMLGIADPEGILKLIDAVESYGIDAMSTGVILAWATEAQGRGIISDAETLGIKLDWGNYLSYIEALKYIVEQPNDFYRALAKGVDHAAAIYGGADYAMAFGGNEMAGYHTGPGAHVGFLVGARHSHLDNGGYAVDQKIMVKKKLSPEDLAQELLKEEKWRQIMSSLVTCFFARGLYTTETVIKALHVAGFELTADDLDRIGDEIHRAKYIFKLREGFSFDDLRIPKRTMETMSPVGPIDEEYMRKAIDAVKQALVSAGPTPKETA